PLCAAPGTQAGLEAVPDDAGGALVVWVDYRNYFETASDIYGQRVLSSGAIAPGWPPDGLPLTRSPGFDLMQPSGHAVTDNAGGVLVAYEYLGSPLYHIHAQHF